MKNQAAKIKKSFTGLFDNFKIPGLGGGSGGGGGNGKKMNPCSQVIQLEIVSRL